MTDRHHDRPAAPHPSSPPARDLDEGGDRAAVTASSAQAADAAQAAGAGPAAHADERLLAQLYDELRKLARSRMRNLPPGNTLQPTALVHEAWLRLAPQAGQWNGRGHFFGAAALAMRRILVDQARRKSRLRHGGDQRHLDIAATLMEAEPDLAVDVPVVDLLALDEALTRLERDDPRKAQIVQLRYFAGLEREEVAEVLGISVRTVDREWRYCVARLRRDLAEAAE